MRTASRIGLRFSWRQLLFLLTLAGSIATCLAVGVLPQIHEHAWGLTAAFFLLLPMCLTATLTWPRSCSVTTQAGGLLLFALVLRLALFFYPVDSDANRYLWEGRLIREGLSPYSQVASAPEWAGQRDAYWASMNQKDLRSIYPPVVEWIFAATGGVWYHPAALKALFIVFDLGSIALILVILSARSQPLRLAGLYAFNPVPLIGFAAQGHYDSILIFFVLLALWLHVRGRIFWSWVVLGLAIQTKLIAVLLVPIFVRRGGWRTAWVGAAIPLLPFLPYIGDVSAWLAGVRHFGQDFGFNDSIHALASVAFGSRADATVLCTALLLLWIAMITLLETDLWRAAFFVLGGLIVLSPIVHYWYVSWALILVPLFPSLAWITLSGAMALSFLIGHTSHLWQTIIWVTFGIILAREAVIVLPALVARRFLRNPSQTRSLAVIVPVLNESRMLAECLLSVGRMSPRPDEVIVVDGG